MTWRVAVHEAGHAVAAVHAKLPINEITIDPLLVYPGNGGHIHLDCPYTPIVLLAGMAAEIALLGEVPSDRLEGDRALLACMEFSRSTWRETYSLIRRYRLAVLAIAQALMEGGTLFPAQLYEEVLTPFFPEARHGRITAFEPSFAELAVKWDRQGPGLEE